MDLTAGGAVPSGVAPPSSYHTATAARDLANTARFEFQAAVSVVVPRSGVLSDELMAIVTNPYGEAENTDLHLLDRRVILEGRETRQKFPYSEGMYGSLHRARGYAINAIESLRKYDSAASHELQAELFAIQGYAVIYLADIFCSGVPLSRIEFGGDFHYAPGSSTQQLYQHAIDAFDSSFAMQSTPGDERIRNWARIGKARALLALGENEQAAVLVADIGLGYQFNVLLRDGLFSGTRTFDGVGVADREGMNGFPFMTGGDPRTAVYEKIVAGIRGYLPVKYRTLETGLTPFTIASGIEAYLIRAEAALTSDDAEGWLQLLNDARASQRLAELDDPVQPDERYRLMMNERAAWLFLTGHRQGDLRRMVRNRKIPQEEVYPSGSWLGTYIAYGTHTNVAIPQTEYANPLYRGCLDRNA